MHFAAGSAAVADGAHIEALDTAGAWVLQALLVRLRAEGTSVALQGLRPEFARLLDAVARHATAPAGRPAAAGTHAPALSSMSTRGCGALSGSSTVPRPAMFDCPTSRKR